jgi:hypothetical protein
MPVLEPSPAATGHNHIYGTQVQISERFAVTLLNRFKPVGLVDLVSRRGLLAVSIKNPRFSNALISAFARECSDRLAHGLVTIVDRPYERNLRAAGRGSAWEHAEIEKLGRISAETRVRVIRTLAKEGAGQIQLLGWDALAEMTPSWLVDEIRAGWNRRGIFYADVLAQTRAVIPAAEQPVLERYAEFILEELPVLLHLYYFGREQLVDFYPGPQSMLFWKLESGTYAEELPELARRLIPREGLVYAHVIELLDEEGEAP